MTSITKVGVSLVDHMNDEANSFIRERYQDLSTSHFSRREPGTEARSPWGTKLIAI